MNSREITKGLSNREKTVLRLIMMGKPNKEIANELSLSVRTVEHHVTQLISKVSVRNRTELALWGRDNLPD
jgi:DNA-binding NarL/FixJ family response regulator